MRDPNQKHLVIVGGGFGGLFTAQHLAGTSLRVTLIDRRNFHLFQPLLYQVATGGLSPGDIASPLRGVLRKQPNVTVLKAEVTDLDPKNKQLIMGSESLGFDFLVLATGVRHSYFGNDQWAKRAPGLKSIENALDIRGRILAAFESAELETDPQERQAAQRFLIVGAGPTGVELAGALGELVHATMRRDFRRLNLKDTEIILVEGAAQVLPSFPAVLGHKAEQSLARLGVTVRTQTLVTGIDERKITLKCGDEEETVEAQTVLWAAGVRASRLGQVLHKRTGVTLDRVGRVKVGPDLSLPGYGDIFVIGDLACFEVGGRALPGVAPVAMQQGRYLAGLIKKRLAGKSCPAFKYTDKGSLAVIGRNAAVAAVGRFKFSGRPAWLIWALVHIHYLIEFGNKAVVSFQWFWNYITRKRGARLITEVSREDDTNFKWCLQGRGK